MRRGFTGLSALVQTALEQDPLSGHVFVFRGRRGDLIKLLWFDGDGLCLFAKRLERGRFIWPQGGERNGFADASAVVDVAAKASIGGVRCARPIRCWRSECTYAICTDICAAFTHLMQRSRFMAYSACGCARRTTLPDLNTLDADALKALILAQQQLHRK